MPIRDRFELQSKLGSIFGDSTRIHYQPSSSDKLKYPCLIYTIKDGENWHADNKTYAFFPFYDVTHIYKNPDDGLAMTKKLIEGLDGVRYDRAWKVDNLYHENLVVW